MPFITSPWVSASATASNTLDPVSEIRYKGIVKDLEMLNEREKKLDTLLTWLNGFIFGVGLGATVAIIVIRST